MHVFLYYNTDRHFGLGLVEFWVWGSGLDPDSSPKKSIWVWNKCVKLLRTQKFLGLKMCDNLKLLKKIVLNCYWIFLDPKIFGSQKFLTFVVFFTKMYRIKFWIQTQIDFFWCIVFCTPNNSMYTPKCNCTQLRFNWPNYDLCYQL